MTCSRDVAVIYYLTKDWQARRRRHAGVCSQGPRDETGTPPRSLAALSPRAESEAALAYAALSLEAPSTATGCTPRGDSAPRAARR